MEPNVNPKDSGTTRSGVFQTATEMLGQMRSGQISAVELLDLHLDQVCAVNSEINAIVAFDEDRARHQARLADEARCRGEDTGSLHGLPMTIKDVFSVVGMPVTGGLPHLSGYMPESDSEVVTALREAGAVIFGKSNVPEGAGDHQSYNAIYGSTNNPWDLARTPGGSSGGAAAALAAGMTPLEIGSDVGGSIRCPAHFCGVYGHKSSYGVVPVQGHVPPGPNSLRKAEMLVAGPMARDPHDLELLFNVISRPKDSSRDANHWPLPETRHQRLEDFRVAVWLDEKSYPVDTRYGDTIEGLVEDLKRLGANVRAARPDIDPSASQSTYFKTLFGEFCASAPQKIYDASIAAREAVGGDHGPYGEWIAAATTQALRTWQGHLEHREQMRRKWAAYFREFDVLICPVMSTVAFPHDHHGADHVEQLARTIEISGEKRPYLDNLLWPGVVTVANLPSTVVPTRRFVDGLPAGAQIVGDFLEDRTTLRFAQLLHDRLGGYEMPPRWRRDQSH
ncbi:amidase [Rhizobium vallis]|uniref:Amidase n=1 Tax=Rhizobium vallis TaxID=634290 RepID=A0A432PCM2_9HYPH|nr:amidase [Rhizobium vallis]